MEMFKLLKADQDTDHIDVHVPVTLPGGIRLNVDFIVWKKFNSTKSNVPEAIEVKGFSTIDFNRMRKLFDAFHPLSPLRVFRKKGGKWENL